MSRRIYDAEFTPNTSHSHHLHLGKFWWIDDKGNKGTWTREQAYEYVLANRKTVYVAEGQASAWVEPYHSTKDPSITWVQTDADGKLPDNLLTLARRHG